MEFKLEKITLKQKEALGQLLELYYYDFTEFRNFEVNEEGRFQLLKVDALLREKARHSFFVRVNGCLAGFVLVKSLDTFGDVTHMIDEFFIMRRYRRKGIGQQAALQVFDLFPGRWTLAQIEENQRATAFWRYVISQYTGGIYEEKHENKMIAHWFSTPAEQF